MTADEEWRCDCYYVLDAHDCLLATGAPAGEGFARENGGGERARAPLAGSSIYEYVAGHFTRRFLRDFFAQCRAAGPEGLSRVYRCDSPQAKRLMEMRGRASEGGALRVEHRLVAQTPMRVEASFRQAGPTEAARALRCSMCNRLRSGPRREWREPDQTPPPAAAVPVVHTVCPDCRRGLAARLPHRPAEAS